MQQNGRVQSKMQLVHTRDVMKGRVLEASADASTDRVLRIESGRPCRARYPGGTVVDGSLVGEDMRGTLTLA